MLLSSPLSKVDTTSKHSTNNSLEKQFFQPLKNFLWFIENHLVTYFKC